MGQKFARMAHRSSELAGHYVTFIVALLILVVWAMSGPFFGFSDS